MIDIDVLNRYYVARALGNKYEEHSSASSPFIEDQDGNNQPINGEENYRDEQAVTNGENPMHGDEGDVSPADVEERSQGEEDGVLSLEKVSQVFQLVQIPAFSVFFVFTVTIGLFPSLIVLLESTEKCRSSERFYNDLYVPFFFLLFNLFDFIGRVTAGIVTNIFTAKNVWIPSVMRLVFIPLFLFCRLGNSQIPTLFNHDAFPILFMVLMALTNGFVASTCMMLGAGATNAKDSPIAGTIMIFCLTSGLFMGACVSFLVVFISQGKV